MNSSSGVAGALTNQPAAKPAAAANPVPSSWDIGIFHHGNPIYGKAERTSGMFAS